MKRLAIPVLVFVAVMLTCCLALPYTIIWKESIGLFLNTPDFMREVGGSSLPLSSLIAAFLTQFFRYRIIGPAVIAALITIIFLLARFATRRLGLRCDSVCAAIAGAAFYLTASGRLEMGVLMLLICAAAAVVAAIFFKKKPFGKTGALDMTVSAVVIVACVTAIAFKPGIKRFEDWCAIEYGCYVSDWDLVLSRATPEKCEDDRMMTPFALLALNCKNELADKMFSYPVSGEEDLHTEGVSSFQGYLFDALLYRELGSVNEWVHGLWQAACSTPHTNCFLLLRELVASNYSSGNYTLARKYCDILSRSNCHKRFTGRYYSLMEGLEDAPADSTAESATALMMSHTPVTNLISLSEIGIDSPIAPDRLFCSLLARKDLDSFALLFPAAADRYQRMPRHYQEALAVLDILPEKVSPEVRAEYERFRGGEKNKNSFWYYLMK